MKTKTYNIEQLRCNHLDEYTNQFDMVRYEEFIESTSTFTQPHRHNYYMVLFATEGEGSQLIDFQEYDIKKGQIFLMYPGQIHAWREDRGLKGYLIFFTSSFFGMRYHNHMLLDFPFFNASSKQPYVVLPKEEVNRIKSLFDCMLHEYDAKHDDYMKVLRSYLNIVLIEAKRVYDVDFINRNKVDQNASLIVKNFEQLINQHYKEKHKVKEYAELLLLTPNYLNAVCNKITDKAAGELIRGRIMLEAKRMLLHENLTVAEIGHELGFEDNSYFCRFFKKYEGRSPERFRKFVRAHK
ncbi:MAG: AraC family transcriptional regulator [Bacteroidota bacterium]